jgi:hypothetical protein
MRQNANTKQIVAHYLLLLFMSGIFLLFFSKTTTPLYLEFGTDSDMFISMGKMLLDGKVPYIDFFDHKGPVIFFIEAFGQIFFEYETGAFFLQVINLFLVLVFIDKTSRILISQPKSYLVILLFLTFFVKTIQEGNCTEEYSLISLFITLYVTFRYYFATNKMAAINGLVIGLCFSCLFWMRLNNAGGIVACCIFIFITCLLSKDYKSIKNLVLYFILGMVLFSIPILAYFIYHGALYEMIYGTFIHNIRYAGATGQMFTTGSNTSMNIMPVFALVLGSILYYLKKKDAKIFILTVLLLIFNVLFANMGYLYLHYFVLISFSLVVGCILILYSIKFEIKPYIVYILIACCAIFITVRYFVRYERYQVKDRESKQYVAEAKEIFNQIPSEERNKAYYYQVRPNFYTGLKISTNYKYFTLQDWMGGHNASIYNEINTMMLTEKPLWVMMQKSELIRWNKEDKQNDEFRRILAIYYDLYAENKIFVLYHRKDLFR